MTRLRRTLATLAASAGRGRVLSAFLSLAVLVSCVPKNKPVVAAGAPRYPDYPALDVPATLQATAEARQAHAAAWQRFQSGDSRGATRDFTSILKRAPDFYPADAGLGYVALADKNFKSAAGHFADALAKNDRYIPALQGQVEAQLGLHNDEGAVVALQQLLQVDPSQQAQRNRLEVLRLKLMQAQIDAARRDRDAGRLDQAQAELEHGLTLTPNNAVLLRELAIVETAQKSLDSAEAHLRRSLQLDSQDPETHAALGAVLEAKERYRDAADAYARAAALDPRPAWRERVDALRSKAVAASIPPEFRSIADAPTVTRGQVAAMIGLRLGDVVAHAPRRVIAVATDVRGYWAADWILQVTQAGVMDIFPNHTFQPNATVRRSDLARVVTQLLSIAAVKKPDELARWKAARPRFSDLPPGNLSYPAAALAVASGAMTTDDDRFAPTRPATGADLISAISRIDQIAGR